MSKDLSNGGGCRLCGDLPTHTSVSDADPADDAYLVCEDHADPRTNVKRTVTRVLRPSTHTVTDYYDETHAMPGPFRSIAQVKRANANAGFHFFDADAMRGFGSRLYDEVYGGRVIITSEQDRAPYSSPENRAWSGQRRYTVRVVKDDGSLNDAAPVEAGNDTFGYFDTLGKARTFARKYAAGEVPSTVASWITERKENAS